MNKMWMGWTVHEWLVIGILCLVSGAFFGRWLLYEVRMLPITRLLKEEEAAIKEEEAVATREYWARERAKEEARWNALSSDEKKIELLQKQVKLLQRPIITTTYYYSKKRTFWFFGW